jgi:serine protease Do
MTGRRWWKGVSLAVLCGALSSPAWGARREDASSLWLESQQQAVRRERSTLSRVAQAAMPSVVSITTQQAPTGQDTEKEAQGIGSGVIIHPDGFILTSAHVIEGAVAIQVTLLSESGEPEEYPAAVVGEDTRTDFALLKVKAPRKLPVLRLSSSSHVDVGDWIVVIGNPFGLAHSVTVGVVSAKGRTDVMPQGRDGDFDYMQMDASINPGNSGGPVINLQGEVVAIANAVNVAGQGIGFAIPIDIAKAVLPHLQKYGHVRRGWMGVSVEDCTPQDCGTRHVRGAKVSKVEQGSPASRAGLRVGDIIEGVDAGQVERAHNLRWQVATRGVGQSVMLRVRRGERPMKLRVRLEELPKEELVQAPPVPEPGETPGVGGSGLPIQPVQDD